MHYGSAKFARHDLFAARIVVFQYHVCLASTEEVKTPYIVKALRTNYMI